MSTPQAKRRRLNDATKTLHKPFKSPFRTPLKPNLGSDPPSSDPPEIGTPSVPTASNSSIVQERPVSYRPSPDHSTTDVAKPLLQRSSLPTPTRPRPLQKKATPSKPGLRREIVDLRNDIQILSQAHALATSSKDNDLLILVERWRTASRAAAEELFATTRDRVNRMGGVGAWKDREREQKEWKIKAEREEMEAERERLEEARDNGEVSEDVYEQYTNAGMGAEQEEKETFKAADDDSFTMDMMLKTLNIDLNLIGYNKEAQRWDG
ncbi:hypothetical protein P171DRAFT_427081 [Karstenula rhodostoma CBS 690.94]|uniref:Swi5-domain-containing protein n=1 Tax=Karstenula rhodostoma CBS 690.94 TaxID=1392251 RepID=A0A9P4PV19_9PLEO|nr:hypothetical protein P171DRAFT_427081 [Karstenula rhodostoma CBS 690.94]